MSNYSFDLLARIGLTQGFLPIFINLSHQSLLDYSPTITFFRWVIECFSTKGSLVFKSPVRCFSPCCCPLTSGWGLRWTRCWTWSWSSRKSITELWISTDWQDTSSTPWLLYVHRSATQRSEHWGSSRTLWSSWGEEQLENTFTDRAWRKKHQHIDFVLNLNGYILWKAIFFRGFYLYFLYIFFSVLSFSPHFLLLPVKHVFCFINEVKAASPEPYSSSVPSGGSSESWAWWRRTWLTSPSRAWGLTSCSRPCSTREPNSSRSWTSSQVRPPLPHSVSDGRLRWLCDCEVYGHCIFHFSIKLIFDLCRSKAPSCHFSASRRLEPDSQSVNSVPSKCSRLIRVIGRATASSVLTES